MSKQSCPCCSDQRIWKAVEELLKQHCLEMDFCPVCGQRAYIRNFELEFRAKIMGIIPEMVLDENGNPMFQDRDHRPNPATKFDQTPISYEIDLDKIDISREMEILEKHREKTNSN